MLLFIMLSAPAFALSIDAPLADAQKEAQAKALFYDIRCAVCQGESIAESQAEVARDLRAAIRAQLLEGKQPDEIKTYLASRYGDGILMRPPVKPATYALWFGPLIILAAALYIAFQYFRRPTHTPYPVGKDTHGG